VVEVADRAEQAMLTAKDGLILTSGNPMAVNGLLYAVCKLRATLWYVIEITSDPADPNRCTRIPKERAQEQIDLHGRDDPWVQVYLLGKFPDQAINQLLTREEVALAMQRQPKKDEYDWAAKILGVDVAFQGLDQSVIFPRQGLVAFSPQAMRGVPPIDGAASVARKATEWGANAIFIDNTGGGGAGWLDVLRGPLSQEAIGIQFSGKPTDPRFYNKRAEMYWRLREWVLGGGSLPKVAALIPELTELTYSSKMDRLKLEDKEKLSMRLGRSPDHADALALTFAQDVAPRLEPGSLAWRHTQQTQRALVEEEPAPDW
jgi:hypothetical protein